MNQGHKYRKGASRKERERESQCQVRSKKTDTPKETNVTQTQVASNVLPATEKGI
jgi:hypothetical protein